MDASWKANWRLCSGLYLPLGSCLSQQQLVASSLSFYLYMYICMLSKPQVTDMSQVAQFSYMYFTHKTSVALIHVLLSQVNIKEWGQVLQHLVDILQNFTILGLHSGGNMDGTPLNFTTDWHQEPKNVLVAFLDSRNAISQYLGHLAFLLHQQWNNELGYEN